MSAAYSRQIPLSLPHNPAFGRDDFLIGKANAQALALVDGWIEWPTRSALLVGPAGSGKSHLVEIWRKETGAEVLKAGDVSAALSSRREMNGAIALEDLHEGPLDEPALFHLLNLVRERQTSLLLTSRAPVGALSIALADLSSRLRAVQQVELAKPDDELLRRVLVKLFSDRQISIEGSVVDYLVNRMERSLGAANDLVSRLDEMALSEQRAVTVRLAAAVLESSSGSEPDIGPGTD